MTTADHRQTDCAAPSLLGALSDGPGRLDIACIAVLVVMACAIRLWFVQFYRVISADGVAFATLAKEWVNGHIAAAFSSMQPPFYPLLIAAVHLFVADVELAGRIAAALAGGLVVIPLYLLALRLGGRRTAVMACLLLTVWPTIRGWSCEVMSQSTYMALILLAYLSYFRALLQPTLTSIGLTAATFAIAYLTRPEGFIPFALLSGYLVLYQFVIDRRNLWAILRNAGVYWLVFAVLVSPYVIQIHNATGQWQLSAKSAPVIGAALQNYLGRPDIYHEIGYKGFSLWDVLTKYPDFVLSNSAQNLSYLFRDLPLYVWLPAFVGAILFVALRAQRLERLWLLCSFAPLLLIITFYPLGSEYSQFYWPIVFIWFAMGMVWLEAQLCRAVRLVIPTPPAAGKVSIAVVVTLVLAIMTLKSQLPDAAAVNRPYSPEDDGGRYDHKLIGQRLKRVLPKDVLIMTRSGRITFYSERGSILYPQAPLADILVVARQKGVRFLVVDGSLISLRPQLGPLLQPLLGTIESCDVLFNGTAAEVIPGVKPYYLYKSPDSQGVVVYELQ